MLDPVKVERAEADKVKPHDELYLRFGALPPGGRSPTTRGKIKLGLPPKGTRCNPGPLFEAGASCFRARRIPGGYEVDVSVSLALAISFRLLSQTDRPIYIVEGREVGLGRDHEPLLIDAVTKPLPLGSRVQVSGHHAEEAVAYIRRRAAKRWMRRVFASA